MTLFLDENNLREMGGARDGCVRHRVLEAGVNDDKETGRRGDRLSLECVDTLRMSVNVSLVFLVKAETLRYLFG